MAKDFDDTQDDRCPICDKDPFEDTCEHHLATFDCTFDENGDFGIGLLGGALCKVPQIEDLFDTLVDDYANARLAGKDPASAVPHWAKQFEELTDFLDALAGVKTDPSGYENEDDFTNDVVSNMSYRSDAIRHALNEWVDDATGGYDTTESNTDYLGPGESSAIESWWCDTPAKIADAVSATLKTILSKRQQE